MHNTAFEQNGIDFAYVPLKVKASDLETATQALRIFNFRGANVTLPHKQAIVPFLDEVSDISKMMGVVNTITNNDGRLFGTTTDPYGFLTGFSEAGYTFTGKSIAIFGNGGSARTLVFALMTEEKAARIILVGRNVSKSAQLLLDVKNNLASAGVMSGTKLELLDSKPYSAIADEIDIVVNATPLGMHPNTDSSPVLSRDLRIRQIVYDIVYVPERTLLIREAESMGLQTVGGLGMLVHQGLASFQLWTGSTPEANQFYVSAREQLTRSGRPEDHKPRSVIL